MSWPSIAIAADIAIVALVLEAALLAAIRLLGRRGPSIARLGPNLASGALILLSLRCVASGVSSPWPLVPLALSLVTHLIDLRLRWHRDG